MAKHLSCKVRAVLSISLAAMALVSYAQSSDFTRSKATVTFSCKNMRVEDVFERLSQQADVYFIYSSSVIELNKLLTINARHQPLHDLLKQIGQQMNLTFRYEGKYIIVKKNKNTEPLLVKSSPKPASFAVKDEPAIRSLSPDSSGRASRKYYVPKELIFTSLTSFVSTPKPFVDSSALFNVLLPSHHRIVKKWYASAGIIGNDHTRGGVEIRGGLKYAYAIVNAAYVNEDTGLYRIGYGAGTSIPLLHRLSLNISYNYSRMRKELNVPYNPNSRKSLFERSYHTTLKHHQAKLLLQYSLTKNIDINLGTSLNLLYSNYAWQNTFILSDTNTPATHTGRTYPQYIINKASPLAKDPIESFLQPHETRQIKTWLSWEAGIFYRINF